MLRIFDRPISLCLVLCSSQNLTLIVFGTQPRGSGLVAIPTCFWNRNFSMFSSIRLSKFSIIFHLGPYPSDKWYTALHVHGVGTSDIMHAMHVYLFIPKHNTKKRKRWSSTLLPKTIKRSAPHGMCWFVMELILWMERRRRLLIRIAWTWYVTYPFFSF